MVASREYREFVANQYGIKNYPADGAESSQLIDQGFVLMRDMIRTYDIRN